MFQTLINQFINSINTSLFNFQTLVWCFVYSGEQQRQDSGAKIKQINP